MSSLRVELFENGKSMGSHMVDEKEQVVVGSGKTADLVVPGNGVAAIHALVRVKQAQGISVFDLGSPAGTYVGNKRVVEMLLPNGSRFRIGTRELCVSLVQDQQAPEKTLFWNRNQTGHTLLHALYISQGRIIESEHIAENKGKLKLCTELGLIFVNRAADGSTTITTSQELSAEVYSQSGAVEGKSTGQSFSISNQQKIRLLAPNAEIQVFWTGHDERLARTYSEQDSYLQKRSYVVSFFLFLLVAASMFLVPHKEPIPEEALVPKSEYTRVTMDSSAPQGGPAQSQAAEPESSQQQAAAPAASKPQPAQQAVNQLLSKLLTKPDPSLKISANGTQTARAVSVTNSKFAQTAVSGGVNTGSLNSQAVSAGLQSAGGSGAKGLNGFTGKGIGGSGGLAGTGQGNGNGGFGLNLGSDEAEAIGGLDKALIAAVVQANLGQIKHCYERQLLVDNSIAGKVVAGWTIDGSGSVIATNIKNTTLNSAPVENCIQARIKTWKFPQPKGGGKVLVSYPFLFKALN